MMNLLFVIEKLDVMNFIICNRKMKLYFFFFSLFFQRAVSFMGTCISLISCDVNWEVSAT